MKRSLGVGAAGEDVFARVVGAAYSVEKNRSKDLDGMIRYDFTLSLDDWECTAEVKYDVMAAKTGNLAIEYYNTRSCKPSGITATTSDIWAVVLSRNGVNEVWLASVSSLRHHFETVKPVRDVINAGDGNAAIRLFRADEILAAVFRRADQLSREGIIALVTELSGG